MGCRGPTESRLRPVRLEARLVFTYPQYTPGEDAVNTVLTLVSNLDPAAVVEHVQAGRGHHLV